MIIMLIVAVIILFVLNLFMDIYLAAGITASIFLAWYKFNQHSASVGLFKANLFAYRKALESGMSEDAAASYMIASRFPSAAEKAMEEIEAVLFEIIPIIYGRFSEPGSEIKGLVCAIFCYENRIPFASITTSLQNKYITKIQNEYDKLFIT